MAFTERRKIRSRIVPGRLPQVTLEALTFLYGVDVLMRRARDNFQLEYDRAHLIQARTSHAIRSCPRIAGANLTDREVNVSEKYASAAA